MKLCDIILLNSLIIQNFFENVKNFDINYENLYKEKKLNDKRKNIFFVIKKK